MHSARLSKSEETAAYSTFQNAVKHKKKIKIVTSSYM